MQQSDCVSVSSSIGGASGSPSNVSVDMKLINAIIGKPKGYGTAVAASIEDVTVEEPRPAPIWRRLDFCRVITGACMIALVSAMPNAFSKMQNVSDGKNGPCGRNGFVFFGSRLAFLAD